MKINMSFNGLIKKLAGGKTSEKGQNHECGQIQMRLRARSNRPKKTVVARVAKKTKP